MAQARQLSVPFKGVSPVPRMIPGHLSKRVLDTRLVIWAVVPLVFAAVMVAASNASAQTCLRPKWTECVQFPNGGRHTGVSPPGTAVTTAIPSGPGTGVGNKRK